MPWDEGLVNSLVYEGPDPSEGRVLSYPKGKQKIVCYGYEPWHWRYVGRELAAEIRESGLPLRKFLWRRFESK